MKKLLIILALCSMCICSCTTAPPAESPAESSTEAATTAEATEVTTAASTEVEEVEKFKPTADNVIWGKYGGIFNDDLFFNITGVVSMPLGITISPRLEELIETADEDDRIAVMFLPTYNGKEEVPSVGGFVFPFSHDKFYNRDSEEYEDIYDKYLDPFCRLPEGYKEKYVLESDNIVCFAFMTPEEISKIIINKNTGFMMDGTSYKRFLNLMGYYTKEELMTMTEEVS